MDVVHNTRALTVQDGLDNQGDYALDGGMANCAQRLDVRGTLGEGVDVGGCEVAGQQEGRDRTRGEKLG